jgi:propanol-preferring alcohol dehydrogenase
LSDEKLQVAKNNGADVIINSKKEKDPVKAIMDLTDGLGADAVIDFVNASKTVEIDMQILRRRARLVLVVSNRFKLDQATEALTKLKEGKIIGRGVINP